MGKNNGREKWEKNAWLKGRENIREKKIRYDEAKREIEWWERKIERKCESVGKRSY